METFVRFGGKHTSQIDRSTAHRLLVVDELVVLDLRNNIKTLDSLSNDFGSNAISLPGL